jgi:regulator of protease activity HflC (stomatin/prohibitin superfamily)
MDPIISDILWTLGFVVGVTILWVLVGYPHWRVWSSHQRGLADLQQAKNEQQIQIAQAQSRLDAAELNKRAAIIEAEAVAEQIKAIGGELTHHDLYLRWQWIKMMEERPDEGDHSVIYVPTEANLPILEANRLRGKEAQGND